MVFGGIGTADFGTGGNGYSTALSWKNPGKFLGVGISCCGCWIEMENPDLNIVRTGQFGEYFSSR
jgi:hypothetical protein